MVNKMQNPKSIEPGCVAVIVRSASVPANVGRSVTVIRGIAPGHQIGWGGYTVLNTSNEYAWLIEAAGIVTRTLSGRFILTGWSLVENSSLRRIDDYQPGSDDLELYNRQGQLEKYSQCQEKRLKFSTRAH